MLLMDEKRKKWDKKIKCKLWSMLTISLRLIFKSHRLLSEIALQVADLLEGGAPS
jgi:hypothetical protein